MRKVVFYIQSIVQNYFVKYFLNAPEVMLIGETIHHIGKHHSSVSRFGDGELMMILGHNIRFQEADATLQERLRKIIQSDDKSILITLPDVFSEEKLNLRTDENQQFWRNHLSRHRADWYRFIAKDKNYYNTAISRFYYPMRDKQESKKNSLLLKEIWKDQEILIVEGEFSRLGVGNDLFDSAVTIKRIICPSKNAFRNYDEIYEKTLLHGRDQLVLIALGPTATVLAYDLAKAGLWAIDIGHVDMEYMMMRAGALRPIPIPGRILNEVDSNSQNSGLDHDDEIKYNQSILHKIG